MFGSWSGSYIHGDSWQMNSGVVDVKENGDGYDVIGSSGSIYYCHSLRYGVNSYGHGVLNDFVKRADGKIEVLEGMPDMLNMDWIISVPTGE